MIHPLDASRSALRAFSQKTNVIANNVANVNTDGFKKSRTTLEEGPTGGVNARISQDDSPGFIKPSPRPGQEEGIESSNVDLAEELTETMSTQTAYKANLKTLQAKDEMVGTLLDVIG